MARPRKSKTIKYMYQIGRDEKSAAEWKSGWDEEWQDSYRYTDSFLESLNSGFIYSGDERLAYRPIESRLVGGGSWIVILQDIPVNENYSPVLFGMYWAIPCRDSRCNDGFDESGRYKVEILTKHKTLDFQYDHVGLFPHEYMVVNDEMFEGFMREEYFHMQQLAYSYEEPMNLELIERGRSLFEEERESVWALQLDGLSESQACEEYFNGRHVKEENKNIWYNPIPEFQDWMQDTFGSVLRGSRLSSVNHSRRQANKEKYSV